MAESVTRLLEELRGGDARALPELIAAVSAELRAVAARHLGRERRDHTLQPTALVNEAYLRLIDQRARDFDGRTHFVSIASTAMRRILVEHARARLAGKRGSGARRVPLVDLPGAFTEDPDTVVALDDALVAFSTVDPQSARIVEMRWFGGLSVEEAAAALAVSSRTVERGFRASMAWLRERLARAEPT